MIRALTVRYPYPRFYRGLWWQCRLATTQGKSNNPPPLYGDDDDPSAVNSDGTYKPFRDPMIGKTPQEIADIKREMKEAGWWAYTRMGLLLFGGTAVRMLLVDREPNSLYR